MKEKTYWAKKGISWRDLYSSLLKELWCDHDAPDQEPAGPVGLARPGSSSGPAPARTTEVGSGRESRIPDLSAQVEVIMSDHNYAFATPRDHADQDLDDSEKDEAVVVTCDCSSLVSSSHLTNQDHKGRRNKKPHVSKCGSQQSLAQNLGMNLRSRRVNLKTCHRCPCHR